MPDDTIASMTVLTFCSVRSMPESQEFQPIGGVDDNAGSAGASWCGDEHPPCVTATRVRTAIDAAGRTRTRAGPSATERPVLRAGRRVGHHGRHPVPEIADRNDGA